MRIALLLLFVAFAAPAIASDPAPLGALATVIERGDYPKTTSVLVVRDGALVYEHYFGRGSAVLLNNTRSASKAFTALAVGAAIKDGAIPSVDTPAFDYLADMKPFANDTPDKATIRIEDMLTMSSALDCDDSNESSPGNEDNMHPQPNWTRWAVDLPTMAGYARDASGFGPWRYCTTNALLVGQIVQRATGRQIDRYIEDKILRPLGIERWVWMYSPAHETMTGGGLDLRSRDWAKVAAMLANDGRWHGRQIVAKDWIDQMLTVRRTARPDQNYGYFSFQGTYNTTCGPQTVWYMAGNGGSQIVILRNLHAAVVVTRENYNVRGTSYQTQEMLERYVLPVLACARQHKANSVWSTDP